MTIERAISGTVYTQLVTTTSILAKLVVCAILLASIVNAQAANDETNLSGVSRRSGVHAAQKMSGARLRPIRNVAHPDLSKLEREWQRLHGGRQVAMLRRFVACGELGACDGLKLASP